MQSHNSIECQWVQTALMDQLNTIKADKWMALYVTWLGIDLIPRFVKGPGGGGGVKKIGLGVVA